MTAPTPPPEPEHHAILTIRCTSAGVRNQLLADLGEFAGDLLGRDGVVSVDLRPKTVTPWRPDPPTPATPTPADVAPHIRRAV